MHSEWRIVGGADEKQKSGMQIGGRKMIENDFPHFRNSPPSKSRFIETATTVAAFVVCLLFLAGFFLGHSAAR